VDSNSFSPPVRDPIGVVPFVMIETRDHGSSIGAELGAERVWIGLKWEMLRWDPQSLKFVDGAIH